MPEARSDAATEWVAENGAVRVEVQGCAGVAADGGEQGGVDGGGGQAVGHVEDVVDHFEGLRAEGEGDGADVGEGGSLGVVEV